MPELPDVTVYVEALARRIVGQPLRRVRVKSPFLLRTFDPPIGAAEGRIVRRVRRIGKRIVLDLDGDQHLAMHLMIAGRLQWKDAGAKLGGRADLAALDFPGGTLVFTEASTKQRAAMHLLAGEDAVAAFEAGGIEPLDASPAAFAEALRRESHTLKRTLTDPRLFSGIGNAYSDEILHAARLSPMQLTKNLDEAEVERLREATQRVLREWTDRLRAEVGDGWPKKVTAFRKGMAVHGRHGEPCPACGTQVQRIVKGESESNYCPRCQTGGRMLADRSLSKLMHDDWPDTIDEWEDRFANRELRERRERREQGERRDDDVVNREP